MAKSKKEGFQSAAGLIRYFDAEEKTALQIDPRLVVGLSIATIVAVTLLKYLYPT
jgi:preprotein translocase subunit Sec61beta